MDIPVIIGVGAMLLFYYGLAVNAVWQRNSVPMG